MNLLAERTKDWHASPTLALAAKAKELKDEGLDVISLSVGEPDWDTFPMIKERAVEAIKQGVTKYTPASGVPALRTMIARQASEDFAVNFKPSEVTVSSGGKFMIHSAFHAMVNPGDEILIPAPYWVSYPALASLSGGIPKIIHCSQEDNFRLTPDKLRQNLSAKSKVLVLNSPSNPTGLMYSRDELKALADVIEQYPQLIILSDDIYNRLVLTGDKIAPHLLHVAPGLRHRLVIINGVSKTYSMTGWRLGWAIAPEPVIQAMNKFQSQTTSCANSITQEAAVEAIKSCDVDVEASVELLRQRCDFVTKGLSEIPGIVVHRPEGAFYVWVDIRHWLGKSHGSQQITDSRQFSESLLEAKQVVCVPGLEFGMDGFLRISYAISNERMSVAIERIREFVTSLT